MTQTYRDHPVHDDVVLYVDGHTDAEEAAVLDRWRAGEEPTDRERAILEAWTTRRNLDNALKWLGDTDYREAFGFATLDQVHGQSWSPDVCGCTHHQVFDHRERHSGNVTIHSHRIHKLCDRHARLNVLPEDHKEHHERLLAECRHKEEVLAAITQANGLEPHDRPVWHYNHDHELVIDTTVHPHLTPENVNPILREQFPKHVVHVR